MFPAWINKKVSVAKLSNFFFSLFSFLFSDADLELRELKLKPHGTQQTKKKRKSQAEPLLNCVLWVGAKLESELWWCRLNITRRPPHVSSAANNWKIFLFPLVYFRFRFGESLKATTKLDSATIVITSECGACFTVEIVLRCRISMLTIQLGLWKYFCYLSKPSHLKW